jgi:hypothetical protein
MIRFKHHINKELKATMSTQYVIKINRREGALEIQGEEKSWVDSKLKELEAVYLEGPMPPEENRESSDKVTTPLPSQGHQGSPTTKTPVNTRKTKPASTARPQENPGLSAKLTPEVTKELAEYISERKEAFDKARPAQAAILATFLHDKFSWLGVDSHDLYTVYRKMGISQPSNYVAQLNNATRRNRYFEGMRDGKYHLSVQGENFGRLESKNASHQAAN